MWVAEEEVAVCFGRLYTCNRGGVVFAFRIVEELHQGAAAALRVCEAVLIVLTWLIRRSFTFKGKNVSIHSWRLCVIFFSIVFSCS